MRRSRHEVTPAEESAKQRYWSRTRLGDRTIAFPHIPDYDYTPTGILTITAGRWPSRSWKDTPINSLEQRLAQVIGGIVVLAQQIRDKNLEEARRQEERRQALARYESVMQRRASETQNFNKLEAQATNWERAQRLRVYLDAAEADAAMSGNLTDEQQHWLSWARAKADWLDPLILVSDPILDAPEPQKPWNW